MFNKNFHCFNMRLKKTNEIRSATKKSEIGRYGLIDFVEEESTSKSIYTGEIWWKFTWNQSNFF